MKALVMKPKSASHDDIGQSLKVESSQCYRDHVYVAAGGQVSEVHGLHLSRREALRFVNAILRVLERGES